MARRVTRKRVRLADGGLGPVADVVHEVREIGQARFAAVDTLVLRRR